MKLYGSTTSPYARRLRIVLANYTHDFIKIDVFGSDRAHLLEKNPTLKIPMLEDADNITCPVIFDSGVINQYLIKKYNLPRLTTLQLTHIALIDACTDSLLTMMFLANSDVDTQVDNLYFNSQRERIVATLQQLETLVTNKHIHEWNYASVSLLTLIEWAQFRKLVDFSVYPQLINFVESNQHQKGVKQTTPC